MDGGEVARTKYLVMAAAYWPSGQRSWVLQRVTAVPTASNAGLDQLTAMQQVTKQGFPFWRLAQQMTDAASVNNTLYAAVSLVRWDEFRHLLDARSAYPASVVPEVILPRDTARNYLLIDVTAAASEYKANGR
jgi:hypothetical protein